MRPELQMWMAPFPPPHVVVEYERVLPGTWDRMLTMAEEAQKADILSADNKGKYIQRGFSRGQAFGFLALLMAMGSALYCARLNQPWVAGAFLSMTVMAAATSFGVSIGGNRRRSGGDDHDPGHDQS